MVADTTTDGLTLVPISRLAEIFELNERPKLTSRQSEAIAEAAREVGVSIEPDYRITRRPYAWDETVALYQPASFPSDGRYAGAAQLLMLGFYVAAADGDTSESEADRIAASLETLIRLEPEDSVRLKALAQVLRRRRPTLAGMTQRLQLHLTPETRAAIGPVLVMVAAHDGTISRKELSALRSAYKALGLDPADLEMLLQSHQPAASQPPSSSAVAPADVSGRKVAESAVLLDEARLQRVLNETRDVARMLGEAMRDADEETDLAEPPANLGAAAPSTAGAAPVASMDPRFDGLAVRYHSAFAELIARPRWPSPEFDALARRHDLMPSSLIDVVNEWAQEQLGDFVVEERGEEITVQQALISASP